MSQAPDTVDPRRAIAAVEICNLPRDIRDWFLVGFRSWVAHGGSLEECLGLNGAVGKFSDHPRFAGRYAARDRRILFLASLAEGTRWQKANTVAGWIRLYRVAHEAPITRGMLAHLPLFAPDFLALAFQEGLPMPESARSIDRILKGNRSF